MAIRTMGDLESALRENDVTFMSLRSPKANADGAGQWIANTRRVDAAGWLCGHPKPTIHEAIENVFEQIASAPKLPDPLAGRKPPTDDFEDLLG